MCNHSMSRIHSIQLGEYMLDIRSRQRARVRTKKSGKAATRRMAQVAETNGRAKRGRALRGKRKHSPSITRKRGNTEAKTRRTHDSMTVRCKEPSPSASADTAKSTEERQETERCVQQCMLVGVRKQHRTRRPGTHRQERCDVESLARVPEPTWHGTEAN